MNNQRIRDMALGFAFCAALVGSFYCGAAGSPTSANASPLGTSDWAVVGGIDNESKQIIWTVIGNPEWGLTSGPTSEVQYASFQSNP